MHCVRPSLPLKVVLRSAAGRQVCNLSSSSYARMTKMAPHGAAEIVEHILLLVYSFLGSVRAEVNSARESMDCDMNSISS